MKFFNEMPKGRSTLSPQPTDMVWQDGKMYQRSEAPVIFGDPDDHYSRSVFSGAQLYDNDGEAIIYALDAHIDRLFYGVKELGLTGGTNLPEIPFSKEEVHKATWETVKANNNSLHYIRHRIWNSEGDLGVKLAKNAKLSIAIECLPFESLFDIEHSGLNIMVAESGFRPSNPDACIAAKSGASGMYGMSTKIKSIANSRGFDDVLFNYVSLNDRETYLAECSTNNLLLVKDDGTFVFPKPIGNCLFGTTAQTVLHILKSNGMKVEMLDVEINELMEYKHFVAACTMGNAAGLTPIAYFMMEKGTGRHVKMDKKSKQLVKINKLYQDFIRKPDAGERVPWRWDNGKTTDYMKL